VQNFNKVLAKEKLRCYRQQQEKAERGYASWFVRKCTKTQEAGGLQSFQGLAGAITQYFTASPARIGTVSARCLGTTQSMKPDRPLSIMPKSIRWQP
jgi:hypothetical protein